MPAKDSLRPFLPWAEPRYWGKERDYAMDALGSSWISGGPYVDRLEADFASYVESPHFVATSNGTTAIHAAFLALDVKAGDEIIVPGFGFMAAANIALHMGAVPVFADVDGDSWCMTAETVAAVLSPRTKGIVPVHTYGNMCDMQPICDLAAAQGLWVLEDAAEAIGSRYRGQQAGTIAAIGSVSFHATKTITTGEGGGVMTRDAALRDRMTLYRSHGVRSRRYWHDVAGHNFRLTNVQAAIGCAQLEHIADISTARRHIWNTYRQSLAQVPGVQLQAIAADVDPLMWAVGVRLSPAVFPQGRDAVLEEMLARGVECRPGFYSANQMHHLYGAQETPVSDGLAADILSVPSSPTLNDIEIAHVVHSLLCCAARA